MAALATKVVGIDFSKNALSRAIVNTSLQGVTNVELRLANARSIPYQDESFDLAYTRRGPATANLKTARETHRVLKHGGRFIEEEIGEKDKLNWKQNFGRGRNYPFKESMSTVPHQARSILVMSEFSGALFQFS